MTRDLEAARAALGADGLLDDVTLLDAVGTACLLMAAADGELAPAETRRIADMLITLAGSEESRPAVETALEGLAREVVGPAQAIALARIRGQLRDPGQRRKALACVATVAWADGSLDDAELDLLGRLADEFGVGAEELERLLAVLRDL